MISFLGLALAHLAGAGLRTAVGGSGWRASLASPASTWFALGAAWVLALGWAGAPLLVVLVLTTLKLRGDAPGGRLPWVALGVLSLLVLARPWVPTGWDEFVWLGKARFEAQGFGAGIAAALDPAQRLAPPGYPPLWPAAVGWLTLGTDALDAQVVAASLLVLLAAASALEAWRESLGRADLLTAAVVATPLLWVHARSGYVDLPVGLLGVALLGHLLRGSAAAAPLAVVLVAFKDEGLAHVLAATGAALLFTTQARWRVALPAVAAAVGVLTWRWLCVHHGVHNDDHALGAPQLRWAPTLLRLVLVHATDLATWGVFWALAVASAISVKSVGPGRAVLVMLGLALLFSAGGLLVGPERVRVFAENGTLLNRLLLQLWPAAALVVLTGARSAPSASVAKET